MVHCVKCGKDNPDDPRGTSIFWLLIGVVIIIWGLSEVYNIKIELWPMIIVIFGLLVLGGAIYRLTRRS
jgi:hypothetical protein